MDIAIVDYIFNLEDKINVGVKIQFEGLIRSRCIFVVEMNGHSPKLIKILTLVKIKGGIIRNYRRCKGKNICRYTNV